MNTLELKANNKILKSKPIPSTWDELTFLQLKKILSQNLSKWQIFFVLLNLKWHQFRFMYLLRRIDKEDLYLINKFSLWVSDSERHITKQFLPSFWIRFRKFKGKENFGKLTFWEFVQADTFYTRYMQKQEKEHLLNFLNVLYPSKLKNSKKLLSKLSPLYANIVLLWFSGNKVNLTKKYKHVFPKEDREQNSNYTNFAWIGVIKSLSTGLTDMKKVGEQPVHTALNYLNIEILHNKEREAEQKRNSKK
ncbi:hypothetical protein WAF17_02795 [Bernardetia sp. ABR2-2B]|uniref:hypothetical protein n=1 Tax=Bernardetia sp. ABR2-2B TaxID=3127472 RepID=UPI0030D4E459